MRDQSMRFILLIAGFAVFGANFAAHASSASEIRNMFARLKKLPYQASSLGQVKEKLLPLVRKDPKRAVIYYNTAVPKLLDTPTTNADVKRLSRLVAKIVTHSKNLSWSEKKSIVKSIESRIIVDAWPTPKPTPEPTP